MRACNKFLNKNTGTGRYRYKFENYINPPGFDNYLRAVETIAGMRYFDNFGELKHYYPDPVIGTREYRGWLYLVINYGINDVEILGNIKNLVNILSKSDRYYHIDIHNLFEPVINNTYHPIGLYQKISISYILAGYRKLENGLIKCVNDCNFSNFIDDDIIKFHKYVLNTPVSLIILMK